MRSDPKDNAETESGFVLPYVLVVIAILAIAGTIAAQRLQKASEIVGEMQDRARAERILVSAEAAATYSLLTGNPVTGGYDLSPESPITWEFGLLSPDGKRQLRPDAASSAAQDLWRGNGGLRRYTLNSQDSGADAIVSYRDATGLISVSNSNPDFLLPVLESAGAQPAQARDMLATLADYVDPDDRRRPNGAESFNYRTQDLTPPTNAPLRSYRELNRIMGWTEAMTNTDMTAIKDMTTLMNITGYRQSFATDKLKAAIGIDGNNSRAGRPLDIISQLELNSNEISQSARFVIWAARSDGRYQKRVVDVERFLGGIDVPYRRHWVYDSTVLESDFAPYADGLETAPNGPLNFDELNHVVHASSLRP